MKIKANQKTLFTAFSRVQGVVEKSSIKPITANALIETEEKSIAVSATNLQIGMTARYDAVEIIKPGKISVNARKLFEIVKELPEDEITIEEKNNYRVEISCGKDMVFTIIGLPPEDFPVFMKETEDRFIQWEAEKFMNMLYLTSFSISRDETKQNINGAFIDKIENGMVRMVTTDGYRLSIVDEALGDQLTTEDGILIPQKAVLEISRLLQDKKENYLGILIDKSSMLIKIGEIDLFVRLIEKKFPDYRIIVPGDGNDKLTVKIKKDKIRPALKRMSIISGENKRPVIFSFSGKVLDIKTEDSELGSVEETIDMEKMIERDFSFCINCTYMLDVVNAVEDDIFVEYNTEEENKPILVRPCTEPEKKKYIIMPMIMD